MVLPCYPAILLAPQALVRKALIYVTAKQVGCALGCVGEFWDALLGCLVAKMLLIV